MKTLRAEFRNHQLWNFDAPVQQPERLVFCDGSEVVITLHDAADLLRPNLAALSKLKPTHCRRLRGPA